ncbi:MAG: helix-turn-helix transcriptional regulator [Roseivirga sp.]|nr:helix-turn-helix transcriptional regulator [Roseivirga sp.]
MNNAPIVLLYSAGIIQTLILGAVVIRKRKSGNASNQILLGLLSAILMVLVQYTMIITGNSTGNRLMGELGTVGWFALGPLFYLYALSRGQGFKIVGWHAALFIVPGYNLLQYIFSLFYPGLGFHLLFDNWVIYSYAWLLAYLIHTILFVILSILALRKKEAATHRPLLSFFYLWLVVLVLASSLLLIKANGLVYFYQVERYLVVVFNLFVLMLTFRSLLASPSFDSQTSESKYSNSGLSEKELVGLYEKLVKVMETEKPHLDRKLSLASLGQIANIRENQLSQVFSQYLNSSFYDFVSQYRVKEVEQRLRNPKFAHLKIIALAEDCGFNSRAAFYKTFKEKHGQTPTQYLKSIQN